MQAVGADPLGGHPAHGIRQPGDLTEAGRHADDAVWIQLQPIQEARGHAVGLAAGHVIGVGGKQVADIGLQAIGGGQQRCVLQVGRGAGQDGGDGPGPTG